MLIFLSPHVPSWMTHLKRVRLDLVIAVGSCFIDYWCPLCAWVELLYRLDWLSVLLLSSILQHLCTGLMIMFYATQTPHYFLGVHCLFTHPLGSWSFTINTLPNPLPDMASSSSNVPQPVRSADSDICLGSQDLTDSKWDHWHIN
jgi:hypothetical protein